VDEVLLFDLEQRLAGQGPSYLDKDNPSVKLLMKAGMLSSIHLEPLELANALGEVNPLKDARIDKKRGGVGLKLS
jgi:hypothetical protein